MKYRIQHDFGKAAAQYDQHALLQRQVAQQLFALAHPQFQPVNRILDAGCGTGYFHELARSHHCYSTVTQVDIAEPMCHIAANYASAPPFGTTHTLAADCELLPFADGSFTDIFSSLMIQWTDYPRCLQEFHRILAAGGTLSLATLGTDTLSELASACGSVDTAPHVNRFISTGTLLAALSDAGFATITLQEERKRIYYPTVRALMHSLKAIGARYKEHRRPSLYGKGWLENIEQAYREHYGDAEGLPATWHMYYIVAQS
jgi:malonyl-CoA O-methyltransferase